MLKKLVLSIAFMAASFSLSAQAVLPTSWSFVGSAPAGWTASGTAVYTGSGNTPPAGKFDGTGDYLQIYYANSAGPLTYYLAGNSFSGGTFTIEESVNGTSWTAMRTITNPPAGTYTLFTDNPNPASRYVRFFYTQKVAGNIGVDDINLAVAAAGPSQEINILQGSTTIISGGSHAFSSPVGTPAAVTFTVENLGTANTLNVSSATITGIAAADYSITSSPSSINPSSNSPVNITFTPSAAGTRDAVLTIVSDDADEATYVINLYGVGGNLASEPTASPSALTFSGIKSYRFNASFTPGSPAPDGGYLVLRKTGSPVTDQPADGTQYTRGDAVGSSKVVYSGPVTSFTPNNIVAGTDYYFAIFPYNGPGQYVNYFQSGALTGSVTSAGNMMGNFYNGISTSAPNFISALSALINPHTQVYYSNYGPTNVELFASRDTTGGQKVVNCVYTGYAHIYTYPFDWSVLSREHTYAHSWMPTNPATNLPEYDDQFNLFPVQFDDANQVRSNFPLGDVVTVSQQFMDGKFGLDWQGNVVYEPRDQHKGDAARAMFYMATAYNGVSGNNWSLPSTQSQDVLKNWHWQDLPDAWEIARNDFIDSLQGNRNPFVDSVNFVCYIDFTTMTKINSPNLPCTNTVSVDETGVENAFGISPNPSTGNITISISRNSSRYNKMVIRDVTGKLVSEMEINVGSGESVVIGMEDINPGVYMIELSNGNSVLRNKFIRK